MPTLKNRSVWLMWPKPSQGKVPIDLPQPALLAFVFNEYVGLS
jgi:hypothetical protein